MIVHPLPPLSLFPKERGRDSRGGGEKKGGREREGTVGQERIQEKEEEEEEKKGRGGGGEGRQKNSEKEVKRKGRKWKEQKSKKRRENEPSYQSSCNTDTTPIANLLSPTVDVVGSSPYITKYLLLRSVVDFPLLSVMVISG